MVENRRIAVGISMLPVSIIVPEIQVFPVWAAILLFLVVARCCYFGDIFFDVAVVGKLDYFTWITTILILDLFCHISQHDHKISLVSKKKIHTCFSSCQTTSGAPIGNLIVAFCTHFVFRKSHERTAPNAEQKFTDPKIELGLFLPPSAIWGLNCVKIRRRLGFAPDRTAGAYSAPPDPLAVFKGMEAREGRGDRRVGDRRGGERREREAMWRRGGKGRKGKGKVRDEERALPL